VDKLFSNILDGFIVHTGNPYAGLENSIIITFSGSIPNDLVQYNNTHYYDFLNKQIELERKVDLTFSNLENKLSNCGNHRSITYQIGGNNHSSVIVLVNAYGVNPRIWKYVIDYFSQTHKVITWNNRGLEPEDAGLSLTIDFHIEDLSRILDKENVSVADFVCWCSGTKILLEYYRQHPEKFRTITILNGLFEPLNDKKEIKSQYAASIEKLSALIVQHPNIVHYNQDLITKIINPKNNRNTLDKLKNNPELLNDTLDKLIKSANSKVKLMLTEPFTNKTTLLSFCIMTLIFRNYNIINYLSSIKVPVLLLISAQDVVTPPENALLCLSKFSDCKSILLKDSSHWCLWDQHEIVNSIIKQHLNRPFSREKISIR